MISDMHRRERNENILFRTIGGINRTLQWVRYCWPTCLCCLAILAAGCAPSYWETVAFLQEAPLCCQSPGEFTYTQLYTGDSRYITIDDSTPAYLFPTGKSYFLAFELPEITAYYKVIVSSFALDDGSGPQKLYVFPPTLATYDSSFQRVRLSSADKISLRKAGYYEAAKASVSAATTKLETELSFTGQNVAEKYLVIMTTDTLLAKGPSHHRSSPTGVIHIELLPQ